MVRNESLDGGEQNPRILLIGDPSRLFWDVPSVETSFLCIHEQVLEGVHAAAGVPFDMIALEIRLIGGKLASVLKTLQKHSKAPVVLLAQMYEEPIARRLIQAHPGEKALALDYLICPSSYQWLCTLLRESLPGTIVSDPPDRVPTDSLEKRIRQLERLATEDDLTGLKNRRYVWEFSRQILEHAAAQQGRVTLLVYDIDDFKQYNDRYGHSVGDHILKEAAILMRRCCRAHDVVGRIGGDEFAVIFWDDPQESEGIESERRTAQVDHPREAVFIAQRFQEAFKRSELSVLGEEGKGVLTISGGLASFPDDGTSIQQLFDKADQALLDAKRSGKNRVYLVGRPPAPGS